MRCLHGRTVRRTVRYSSGSVLATPIEAGKRQRWIEREKGEEEEMGKITSVSRFHVGDIMFRNKYIVLTIQM